MKHLSKISWLLIAFALFSLPACAGGSPSATPTVDTAPIYTQIASTALALQTQTSLALPTATNTPQVSPTQAVTNTPLITDTPLPGTPAASATPLSLTTPLATTQASCDNMAYVADATIPDGYVAAPGEIMKKTWTIKNLGPCIWNQDYILIWGWGGIGTDWSKTAPVNLSKVVQPNETVDITVTLRAPSTSGVYGCYFRFQNDKGFNFGPPLTIDISVK